MKTHQPKYDVGNFSLSDMTECAAELRRLGSLASSMEEVARALVDHLYCQFVSPGAGRRSFVLARFFAILPYDKLDDKLQASVMSVTGDKAPRADMNCLTLLASVGEKPEWNSRSLSVHHKVLPLSDEGIIARSPMLLQLIKQLGLEPGALLRTEPAPFPDPARKLCNVFYVREARLSPYVPNQADFVVPYGICSILGFGGVLPSGNPFAIMLFSRDPIPRNTADMFKPLALSAKIAILPFAAGPIFCASSDPGSILQIPSPTLDPGEKCKRLRSHVAALEQLLEVQDHTVRKQSERLERAIGKIGRHAKELASSAQNLGEKQEILQSVLASMGDGVVVADEQGALLAFNPAAERILGIGMQEVPPAMWPDKYRLFLPDTITPYPAEQLPLIRAIAGEAVDEAEIYVGRGDSIQGSWLSVNARPLLDPRGLAKGGVAIFRDITAWKQSAQNLELLSSAVEQTDDTVFIAGDDGAIEYVNPAFERTTGYTRAEVLGKTPRILKSGHHDIAYYKSLWDTILGGSVYRGAVVNRKKSGELYYAEQTITPIRDSGGRLAHFVAVVKDMTDRRRVQAQEVEMKLASLVQQRLYPQCPPRLAGYDIAGGVFSAEATGGDYFDYITMPDGTIGILIGDVSGHGFGPALVMAETRAYLRSLAQEHRDFGEILTSINEILVTDLEEQRYVTLLVAQLDVAGRSLVYTNAGHPPGYVLDRSGAIKATLDRGGPPLGMFRHTEYACSRSIVLEPGDMVILLTDGVTETQAPDDSYFGVEGVLEVLRAQRHQSAKQILQNIHEALRSFAHDRPQLDDETIVLVKLDIEN